MTASVPSKRRTGQRLALDMVMLGLAMVGMHLALPLTGPDADPDAQAAGYLLLPALVLLAGLFAGHLATAVRLPRLTGFIVVGVLVGPYVLGLVTKDQVGQIKLVNDLAIGLIALMAGAEIRLGWLRARLFHIIGLVVLKALTIPWLIMVVVAVAGIFPFVTAAGEAGVPAWVVGLLSGVLVIANSPMVVVSVIKDTGSKGPVTEMAIGSAVATDVVVILGFTLVVTMIGDVAVADAGGSAIGAMVASGGGALVWIFLSVLVGLVCGFGLAWMTERRVRHIGWLLVGLALLVALVEPLLHLKPLFVLIAAGFACENLYRGRTHVGTHRLEQALSQVATPVFVAFFTAAGLGLHLGTLADAWVGVLVLVSVRACLLWGVMTAGSLALRTEPSVRRWVWATMIPQAGVTLALSEIIGRQFPGWGSQMRDLFVAAVAVHELIGPVLMTVAMKRSGEATRSGAGSH